MRLILIVLSLVLLQGCETYHGNATYSPSAGNIRSLKFINASFDVQPFSQDAQEEKGMNCRMAGPVKVTGDKDFAKFFEDAFKDELELAGLSNPAAPNKLSAKIHEVKFDSFSPANWTIRATFTINDTKIPVTTVHNFPTSFAAMFACEQVAGNFNNAAQKFIFETFNSPNFRMQLRQ